MESLTNEDALSSMEYQPSITSSVSLNYDSIGLPFQKGKGEESEQSSLAIENDQHLNNSLASLPSSSSIESGSYNEEFDEWSGSEHETESVSQKQVEDWGDKIISTFIAKRRALLIDQDLEGVVSYEESDSRISAMLLMIGGMLYAISLILLIMTYFMDQSPKLTILVYEPKVKVTFFEPKIAIMDKTSGLLTSMTWNNDTLIKPDWEIELPKSKERDYYPYFDKGAMNIIYGSFVHDMTYVDVASKGACHRIVHNSRFGYSWKPPTQDDFPYQDLRILRVGNILIFFGGSYKRSIDGIWPQRELFLWNTRKYRWHKGPKFPREISGNMCGIGINRTTAMFFGMTKAYYNLDTGWIETDEYNKTYNDGYLKKFTLNIWNGKGIQVSEPHFHDFHEFDAFGYGADRSEVDFDCTTMFNKNADM